jgi:hypothetical protein
MTQYPKNGKSQIFPASIPVPLTSLDQVKAPLVYSRITQNRAEALLGFEVYPASVRVCRQFSGSSKSGSGAPRGKIQSFTPASQSRLKFQILNSQYNFISQYCLTYDNYSIPENGRESKKHLNSFLGYVRKMGIHYIWVLEFQTRRGVPHYHVFLDVPVSRKLQAELSGRWNKIVAGSESHLKVHNHHKNFIPWEMKRGGYLTKYLDKEAQKKVPASFEDAGRFWGTNRGNVKNAEYYSSKIIGDAVKIGQKVYAEALSPVLTNHKMGEVISPRNNHFNVIRWLKRYKKSQYRSLRKSGYNVSNSLLRRITGPTNVLIMDGAKIFRQIAHYLETQYYEVEPC